MKLSLIIPVYNAAATLAQQLDALAAQQWQGQWELILADNGSSDDSLDIARTYEGRIPNLRIIDATERRGAGCARNKAARIAAGEFLAFIDADDVVSHDWLQAVADATEQHDFLASRFDYHKLSEKPEQAYCGGTQVNGIQHMWWPPFYPHSGACGIVIRKTLHEAINGFDENWLYLQDTDYCIRLHQQGARLRFMPNAVIHIRNRSTYKGIFRQGKKWGQYNALLYKRYRQQDNKLPHPVRKYCKDALKLIKKSIRGHRDANTMYQLGWHVGLLKGSLLYRVAPPVVGLMSVPEDVLKADQISTENKN